VRWDAFEEACAELAVVAGERFAKDELVLVGTIRRDGSPRISPNEPEFHCFSLDVGSAGYVRFTEDAFEIWRWSPEAGLSKELRPND
jgi:hypothetical protein